MIPQFATPQAWAQADQLLQPALIRLIDHLRQWLETLPWTSRYEPVEIPFPGHQLVLEKGDRRLRFDLWDLCFEICFTHYPCPNPVEIDQTLLTPEGEVDWTVLDQKVQQCLESHLRPLTEDG